MPHLARRLQCYNSLPYGLIRAVIWGLQNQVSKNDNNNNNNNLYLSSTKIAVTEPLNGDTISEIYLEKIRYLEKHDC